jgi:hypothetical protein
MWLNIQVLWYVVSSRLADGTRLFDGSYFRHMQVPLGPAVTRRNNTERRVFVYFT